MLTDCDLLANWIHTEFRIEFSLRITARPADMLRLNDISDSIKSRLTGMLTDKMTYRRAIRVKDIY